MLIAIFADIQANRQAFSACLAQAHDHGAQRIALLGDYVGYGADPEWTVEDHRLTVHVLEALDPASAILEFAKADRTDHNPDRRAAKFLATQAARRRSRQSRGRGPVYRYRRPPLPRWNVGQTVIGGAFAPVTRFDLVRA